MAAREHGLLLSVAPRRSGGAGRSSSPAHRDADGVAPRAGAVVAGAIDRAVGPLGRRRGQRLRIGVPRNITQGNKPRHQECQQLPP